MFYYSLVYTNESNISNSNWKNEKQQNKTKKKV